MKYVANLTSSARLNSIPNKTSHWLLHKLGGVFVQRVNGDRCGYRKCLASCDASLTCFSSHPVLHHLFQRSVFCRCLFLDCSRLRWPSLHRVARVCLNAVKNKKKNMAIGAAPTTTHAHFLIAHKVYLQANIQMSSRASSG